MKYKLLMMFFIVASCNSQDLIIKKCVNDKIDESIVYKYNDVEDAFFYKAIKEIELYLMQNTNQKNINKRAFINIINFLELNVYNDQDKLLKYKNRLQKFLILYNIQPMSVYGNLKSLSVNCYYKKINKKTGVEFSVIDETLIDHLDVFQKIFSEGYSFYSKDCFNKLINSLSTEKFDKIIYRVPLILMIYENIITKSRK